MSNVLIGIIGVILFIGLALAGALFLGPRFQEATNNSKAAAAVQAVSQIARAADMYNVQSGEPIEPYVNIKTKLVDAGFLKAIPINPVNSANVPVVAPGGSGAFQGNYVFMDVGSGARDVCISIARQVGQSLGRDANGLTVVPTDVDGSPVGCIKGARPEDSYAVFARI